jgi:hypothetical protein
MLDSEFEEISNYLPNKSVEELFRIHSENEDDLPPMDNFESFMIDNQDVPPTEGMASQHNFSNSEI